jgi:hypothetical protein
MITTEAIEITCRSLTDARERVSSNTLLTLLTTYDIESL